jgi:hypothetical protein
MSTIHMQSRWKIKKARVVKIAAVLEMHQARHPVRRPRTVAIDEVIRRVSN